MKNRSLLLALAAAGAIASPLACADSYPDHARVISVLPVSERIPVSRDECWNETRRVYEDRRVVRSDTGAPIGAGTILGAVVGGVLGHQFGESSGGRDRATAAGAIVGGLVGNQIERENAGGPNYEVERVPVERNVQRCRTVRELREATVGYDVRYSYHGHEFTTRLAQDPGPQLDVRVELQPVVEMAPPPPAPPAPPPPPPGPRAPVYR